jgi:hypothetical protein
MTRHLKSLIFDSLSFTEGLFTSLSTTDSEGDSNESENVNFMNISDEKWFAM